MTDLNMTLTNPINQARMDELRRVAGKGPVLILTHDNPDPDALASGRALSFLFKEAWGISSQLIYSGLVARAENQAMLNHLTPEWEYSGNLPDLNDYSAVAQVDTQPGAGNNRLNDIHPAHIVIDHHHPIREMIEGISFSDVRTDIGATVTMLYQYLDAAKLQPDPFLATAMFYGLKTDTRGLSRGASSADEVAFVRLLHRLDQRELSKVELAKLSREYFRSFNRGLHASRIHGQVVISRLGNMEQPDFAAEMADILIRLEGVHTALCLGEQNETLHVSLRTTVGEDAGLIIQQVVTPPGKAGGHGTMAGGQIPLEDEDIEQLIVSIEQRFLEVMGESSEGMELL